APAWLRRLCGHLLSERLLRPGGVQAVVRGVLEGTDGEWGALGGAGAEAAALDWRKCDAVGKILAACPQQCLSLEDYYRQVCPQVRCWLRWRRGAGLCNHPRAPTTPPEPLQHLQSPCSPVPQLSTHQPAALLVIDLCVYVVGNDSSSLLLGSLQSVLGVVFSLYSFAKQNVSYLRSPCQDILLWFLEKAEQEQSLAVLEGLAGLSSHVPTLHPQCQIRVGSEGGATIVVEETISDEDEALYQKISSEQCHVESLVELLSHCQKSGLAGDFFIHCLKELTQVAAEEDEAAPNPGMEPGGSLLELEQYQARQGRKLLVLQLVAALCEGVSDTVFTDIVQVQEFVAAVLHRACAHPAQGPGAAAEAQTLAMAMGLVAAVLGGAVQLQSSDFVVLKRLVPLLEELSRTYPEPLTQELASDLRIAICTHGACSPGTVGTAADGVLGRKAGTGARSPAGVPSRAPRPPSPRHGHGSPSAHRERREEQSTRREPSACGASRAPHADSPAPAGLQELLVSAYDPQPSSRAAALRHLTSLVTQRDPEALQLQEKLLQQQRVDTIAKLLIFQFFSLPGIALLSSEYPERILPVLLARYECPAQGMEDAAAAVTRMKLGEVLMRVTRALGESM
ncbi:TNG6 protein, partial [Ptilorrhoa leucosticta]|nr:TNG6 protein [Ptilorrhoa leucosticta]